MGQALAVLPIQCKLPIPRLHKFENKTNIRKRKTKSASENSSKRKKNNDEIKNIESTVEKSTGNSSEKNLCSNCHKLIESSEPEKSQNKNSITNENVINNVKSSCSFKLKCLVNLVKAKLNHYHKIYKSVDADMLPSMPYLLTPCKTADRDVDNNDQEGETKRPETESPWDETAPDKKVPLQLTYSSYYKIEFSCRIAKKN